MKRPQIDNAPGLAWRARANGWVATWIARADIVKKGFSPQTQRLLLFTEPPTADEIKYIQSECTRLQDEMLAFGRGGAQMLECFDGTVQGLIDAYRSDPDSPYQSVRYKTRCNYDVWLDQLGARKGARALSALGARDFKRWYEEWRRPDGKSGRDKPFTGHAVISMVRILLGFGIAFELEKDMGTLGGQCLRLKCILHEMDFENGKARTKQLTHVHASAIVKEAIRRGEYSVALTQAMQFDLALHQKDCLGEWVPLSEPGLSDVTWAGEKWLYGIRCEEIDEDLILRHPMAKSRKGKMLEFDLKLYPLVMSALPLVLGDRRSGPLNLCEKTGLPWAPSTFEDHWRAIATAVGVPQDVRNMDSRAGATTETIDATDGNLEAARKQAGHTTIKTTQRYSRGDLDSNSKVAVLRAAKREKVEK